MRGADVKVLLANAREFDFQGKLGFDLPEVQCFGPGFPLEIHEPLFGEPAQCGRLGIGRCGLVLAALGFQVCHLLELLVTLAAMRGLGALQSGHLGLGRFELGFPRFQLFGGRLERVFHFRADSAAGASRIGAKKRRQKRLGRLRGVCERFLKLTKLGFRFLGLRLGAGRGVGSLLKSERKRVVLVQPPQSLLQEIAERVRGRLDRPGRTGSRRGGAGRGIGTLRRCAHRLWVSKRSEPLLRLGPQPAHVGVDRRTRPLPGHACAGCRRCIRQSTLDVLAAGRLAGHAHSRHDQADPMPGQQPAIRSGPCRLAWKGGLLRRAFLRA